jgi:hypothetical protein
MGDRSPSRIDQGRNGVDRWDLACSLAFYMNCSTRIFTAIAILGLVSCDTMTSPITSGDFDPLRPAGGSGSGPSLSTGPSYKAGQFVRAALDNTAFYKTRPRGDANADKLLKRGTSMKVISTSSSYLKVELDSGDIGFVPMVMIEDSTAAAAQPLTSSAREYQVYPPLPGSGAIQPLPPSDPSGLPPEGAIPTIIDPEAPAVGGAPAINPPMETFPAPPPTESVPLPPNDADIAAGKLQPAPPVESKKEEPKPAGQ